MHTVGKKRKVNEDKARAALPIENISSFDSKLYATKLATSVITPLGLNNDSRFYRNGLLKKDEIVDDNYSSTISSNSIQNINTVVSFDDDKSSAIEVLRKKIIMELIDINSQTSPEKQKLFSNLVAKTDGTRVVLEMAYEMGTSVKDTKTMLMNNCT